MQDLEKIAACVAEDSEEGLLDRVQLFAEFPRIGYPFQGRRGVRKLTHTPYPIFYRIRATGDAVEIICFWHAARGEPDF